MRIPSIDSQEALDRFMEAAQDGHRLFAHPDTIRRLSEFSAARKFAAKFEPNQHLEPGDLIAVDPTAWTFADTIPIRTVSYSEAHTWPIIR